MKINLRTLLGIKKAGAKISGEIDEQLEYDKYVAFYYTNLINAIVLFSMTQDQLQELAGPSFDPLFELETEMDTAFTPICFESIFRNKVIDASLKPKLLAFKKEVDNVPDTIWDWDCLGNDPAWRMLREKATELLDELGIEDKVYNEDYITVYNNKGKILKKGKGFNI